jgi:type VI secretion system protein VasG
MDDSEGREIDFKNCVILLTSNVGTDTIMRACMGAAEPPEPDELLDMIRPDLVNAFKPAFLGRMKLVTYYPVRDEILKRIIDLKLSKIRRRVAENHRAEFAYGPELIEAVAARCTEVDSGARNIDHILTGTLLPDISGAVLARMSPGEALSRIEVGVDAAGDFSYTVQ